MKTSRKARRIQMLVLGGVLLAGAAGLFGFLAQDAIAFFKSPTELVEQEFRPDQLLRVGGLVVDDTHRTDGTVQITMLTSTPGQTVMPRIDLSGSTLCISQIVP